MAASRTLKLTYLGDASQLSKSTKAAGDDVGKLGDRVKKVGKALAVGFVAIGAAGIAMGKKLFDAFEEVSTANARVEAVVTSMGNFEGQIEAVTERLIDNANATARLTGVDRTLIKESQALLLTFDSINKTAGTVGGVFDRATQAAVDLAAAGFGSVTGNATQLGKALEDPIKGLAALGRSGVTFTEEQKELIKALVESNQTLEAQSLILDAIEKQVGGVAEATANGSDKIRQAFGILTEQIATALAPAFETLVEKGLLFVDKIAKWWQANGDGIIQGFGRFRDRVVEVAGAFREFVDATVDELRESGALGRLRTSAANIGEAFGATSTQFRNLLDLFTGTTIQQKGSLFARYIDLYFVKPFEFFEVRLVRTIEFIERILATGERLTRFFQGTDQLSSGLGSPGTMAGGGMPNDFVAGRVITGAEMAAARTPRVTVPTSPAPRATQNVTVNVTGAIDPERTARQIQNVLQNSTRRVGPAITALR